MVKQKPKQSNLSLSISRMIYEMLYPLQKPNDPQQKKQDLPGAGFDERQILSSCPI